MGSLSLLQGIFPTQGLNPGLPHCRWILYQPSHKGTPGGGEACCKTSNSELDGPAQRVTPRVKSAHGEKHYCGETSFDFECPVPLRVCSWLQIYSFLNSECGQILGSLMDGRLHNKE